MKNADKDGNEALLYGVEVLQRQLAFVELPVDEYLLYDGLHVGLYALWRRVFQGPRSRLHRVREHHYSGLPGLGLGP